MDDTVVFIWKQGSNCQVLNVFVNEIINKSDEKDIKLIQENQVVGSKKTKHNCKM